MSKLISFICVFAHAHPLEGVAQLPAISSSDIQEKNKSSHIQSLIPGAEQVDVKGLEDTLNGTAGRRNVRDEGDLQKGPPTNPHDLNAGTAVPQTYLLSKRIVADAGNASSSEGGIAQVEFAVFDYANSDTQNSSSSEKRGDDNARSQSDKNDNTSDESNSSEEQRHNVTKRETRVTIEKLDDLRPSAVYFEVDGGSEVRVRRETPRVSPGGKVKGRPVKAPVRQGPLPQKAHETRRVRDTNHAQSTERAPPGKTVLIDEGGLVATSAENATTRVGGAGTWPKVTYF
ncbi:uncharacterized protein LOC132698763 [Cylas formicarius]|uniref:uncharacterized protein LOC132698763 n=1 Tax=Cylas formicarius TaxID=197179 RepID=UPI00295855E7|nr:uncharacterized protein LOC132698763 [Cylas formicarius]